MDNKQKGIFFTILSAVSLGITNVMGKLILNYVNVETMFTIWFVFSSLIFIVFSLLTKDIKNFKKLIRKEFIVIGIINTISGLFWGYGLLFGGPNNVSFLGQLSIVITVLLGIFLLREKIKKIEIIGIFLAIAGAFIMGYRNIELTQLSFLIILAYAFVLAIQNFFSKTYIKNIDAISLARGRVFFTLLFFGSFSFLTGRIQYPISIEVMLYALIGAFFGAFLGWMAFFKALSYIEVSKSISIRSIESFFTAISAFLILGLVPTVNQLVGGALIIIGIIALGQTKLGAKQWKHKKS